MEYATKIQHHYRSHLKFKKELLDFCKYLYTKQQEAERFYLLTDEYDDTIILKIKLYNKIALKKYWDTFEAYCYFFTPPMD
jgi:hypothetical protein